MALAQLSREKIKQGGVRVVVIGCGEPSLIDAYRRASPPSHLSPIRAHGHAQARLTFPPNTASTPTRRLAFIAHSAS